MDRLDNPLSLSKHADVLKEALKELSQRSGTMVEASAVISRDGLIKAELLRSNIDPYRFGAMCASLLSLASRAAHDLHCGELRLVLIEGDLGTMIVVQIGEKGVLAAIIKPKAQIGRMFIEVRKTAQTIEKYL